MITAIPFQGTLVDGELKSYGVVVQIVTFMEMGIHGPMFTAYVMTDFGQFLALKDLDDLSILKDEP